WMAVISSEAEKVAQATHMSASEAANYKAQLLAIAEAQRQAKAAEVASNQAFGRVEQVQQIEAEIAALKQLQQANNTSDIRNAIAADIAQLDELKAKGGSVASSWKAYFAQMGVETQNVGVQLSGIFQKGFTSSIDSFSDALGKTIVQGKSLGEEMKKALRGIVEGIIAAIAKLLIFKALSEAGGALSKAGGGTGLLGKAGGALSAAAGGGTKNVAETANTTATTANTTGIAANTVAITALTTATAAATTADAADATTDAGGGSGILSSILPMFGFSAGGVVPGAGIGDTVPAMLEPGEMVLPKNVSQNVQKAAGTSDSAKARSLTVTYAPTVHAVDERGVQDMLDEHGHLFTNHV